MNEQEWQWLVAEVDHWLNEADDDRINRAVESGDIDELVDVVADVISNYMDISDFGFDDTPAGWNKFYRNVRYIIVESNNKGWDYVYGR